MHVRLEQIFRGRLPVDCHEYRMAADGTVYDVGALAMAVNSGSSSLNLMSVDEATIEAASQGIRNYKIRAGLDSISNWIAEKPVLMSESQSGFLLLDGRQRSAKLFAKGRKMVRAIVVSSEAAGKYGAFNVSGQIRSDTRESRRLESLPIENPISSSAADDDIFGFGAVILSRDNVDDDGRRRGKGRLPLSPEFLKLKAYYVSIIFEMRTLAEFMRARNERNKDWKDVPTKALSLADSVKLVSKSFPMTSDEVRDATREAIRTTTKFNDAPSYKLALLSDYETLASNAANALVGPALEQSVDDALYDRLLHLVRLNTLIGHSMNFVREYATAVRAAFRLAESKDACFNSENLSAKFDKLSCLKISKPILWQERLLLVRHTGVDMTHFYWDPPCVRTLASLWLFVRRCERGSNLVPLEQSLPDVSREAFMQRLAMQCAGVNDRLSDEWNSIFLVLEAQNQLQTLESMCAARTMGFGAYF